MANDLTVTNALVTTTQIKDEFCIYFCKYDPESSILWFEGKKIIKPAINYYFINLAEINRNHHVNITTLLYYLDSDIIPKKYRPVIVEVTKQSLSKVNLRRIHEQLNRLKRKLIMQKALNNHKAIDTEYKIRELTYALTTVYVYEARLKIQVISYMELKGLMPAYVAFLKDITKLEGITFDQYIDELLQKTLNSINNNPQDTVDNPPPAL